MTETTPISKVTGVNGNMVSVEFAGAVMQNEVAYVLPADGSKLKSEVIRVRGREADLQVFESTTGVKVDIPESPEEEEWLARQDFTNGKEDAYTG